MKSAAMYLDRGTKQIRAISMRKRWPIGMDINGVANLCERAASVILQR